MSITAYLEKQRILNVRRLILKFSVREHDEWEPCLLNQERNSRTTDNFSSTLNDVCLLRYTDVLYISPNAFTPNPWLYNFLQVIHIYSYITNTHFTL